MEENRTTPHNDDIVPPLGTPSAGAAALVITAVLLIIAFCRLAPPSQSLPPIAAPTGRIDPNTAPWYELTILPGIGEKRARDIVRFRERAAFGSQPVFTEPGDLDQVHGIGPATVARIEPELQFPCNSPGE